MSPEEARGALAELGDDPGARLTKHMDDLRENQKRPADQPPEAPQPADDALEDAGVAAPDQDEEIVSSVAEATSSLERILAKRPELRAMLAEHPEFEPTLAEYAENVEKGRRWAEFIEATTGYTLYAKPLPDAVSQAVGDETGTALRYVPENPPNRPFVISSEENTRFEDPMLNNLVRLIQNEVRSSNGPRRDFFLGGPIGTDRQTRQRFKIYDYIQWQHGSRDRNYDPEGGMVECQYKMPVERVRAFEADLRADRHGDMIRAMFEHSMGPFITAQEGALQLMPLPEVALLNATPYKSPPMTAEVPLNQRDNVSNARQAELAARLNPVGVGRYTLPLVTSEGGG